MMMSEEEKQRLNDAKTCNDCLGWHKHCNAECCKIVFLNISQEELKKRGPYVKITQSRPLSMDEIWYYRMRDVLCTRHTLKFKKERIMTYQNKIMYIHPCKLLDGCKCKGHPNDKPILCKLMSLENHKSQPNRYRVTDNCLYKYKMWLEDVENKS